MAERSIFCCIRFSLGKLTGLAFGLCLCLPLFTQTVTVSEEMSMQKGVDYDLMGVYDGKLLMARISADEIDIQAFDENLYNSWTKTLKLHAKRAYVIGVLPLKEKFQVFYTDIRKDSIHLMVREFDASAKSADSTVIKSYSRMGNPPRFKLTFSDNKELVAIHHMQPESRLEVLFYASANQALMADHLYDMSQFDFRRDFRTIFLSNIGELFIVLDNTVQGGRRHEQMISVIKSGIQYVVPVVIDHPVVDFYIYNTLYRLDNLNQQLVGIGLFSDKSNFESAGVFTFRANLDMNQPPVLKYVPYTMQLVQDFRAGRRAKQETIPNLVIQDMILRADGGVVMIAEERKEYERSLYQGRRDFYSMRFAVDYYYEDLVLIAVNPDGSHHWQKLLQKKQYSFDDDALYSSFFIFKNRSSVRILYNDEIKNENTVSEYILTGGGVHERRSVLSTNRQDLKLQIRNALQISSSELIIPSIKRNKLKLVKVSYVES